MNRLTLSLAAAVVLSASAGCDGTATSMGEGGGAGGGVPLGGGAGSGPATGGGAGGGNSVGGGSGGGSDGGSGGGTANAVGLVVSGNHFLQPDGGVWHGRGANIADPRGCNACTANAPNLSEVKRRIDELVDVWHANFIRLDLESYDSDDGYRDPTNYKSVLADPAYGQQVRELVQYIGTRPGVYVLVSAWVDPSIGALGWPTLDANTGTDATWTRLVELLHDQPHAMFGVINEPESNFPESNFNGAQDVEVWARMNSVVKAIRDAEDLARVPYHVVAVQGTGGWSRRLDYYVTHPITERGGKNVAYEVHVYDPAIDFASLFEGPAQTLPVIIGEFGPASGMTLDDCDALMDSAQAREIPHLAWTFHMRCPPNLLVDNSGGGCGVNMTLTPSTWGARFKARLARPW